ncbi:hypothetical protein [Nocardia sp. X0981]
MSTFDVRRPSRAPSVVRLAGYLYTGVAAGALVAAIGALFALPEASAFHSERAGDGAAGRAAISGLIAFVLVAVAFAALCVRLAVSSGLGRPSARVLPWAIGIPVVVFDLALLGAGKYSSVGWFETMGRAVAAATLLATTATLVLFARPVSRSYFRTAEKIRHTRMFRPGVPLPGVPTHVPGSLAAPTAPYGVARQWNPAFPPSRPGTPAAPAAPVRPSATTAMIAAVLALLGGVRGLAGLLAIPLIEADPSLDASGDLRRIELLLAVTALFALLLLSGGILLLARRRGGRLLIGVGGIGTLVLSLTLNAALDSLTTRAGSVDIAPTAFGVVGAAVNVAVVILVFLPSTSRWLAFRPVPR